MKGTPRTTNSPARPCASIGRADTRTPSARLSDRNGWRCRCREPASSCTTSTARRIEASLMRRRLERDDSSLNRHPALASCVKHDLFRKPLNTPDQVRGRLFRDHALGCRLYLQRERRKAAGIRELPLLREVCPCGTGQQLARL